ncbi:hypothetical protein QBC46DRAFT_297848 [Diplogelasinospora grovesii]|uniref:Cyclin-like domain-containing protein n=1 Tax=Diplogelasinospora grovesii TaxID=303347 RepID=A0AAN6S0J2_9PEZI|nr:hypothetical protein QBC46DRAFT_297848 [Diplogelasinospora grovesii]
MSSATRLSKILATGVGTSPAKPKPKKPNAVRRIMDREQNRERRVRESSVASVVSEPSVPNPTSSVRKSTRLQCANKACKNPNVVDGTCQSCGRVADDSNIVAEVTFGETSSGAAIVQGSYLGADQGGVRGVGGPAFRRVAGGGASEARERSLREAKQLLSQFAHQLRVSQSLAESAYRLYRMASNNNFVQGRRKTNVAAICLYAACRKETTNKVMLIDLADLIKTDVFLLGRSYKEFLSQFPDMREGTRPIILEDLIFRFASRLEFYHDTNKVAESAVRIAARMRHDNMTHGRRPAGICGAALIMAARAHNYRRTVREVVYIAKVTMTTLQERMSEFANVPSAQMTISEFSTNDFLETAHDPPWVYKQSKEWQEKHRRLRKRKLLELGAGTTSPNGEKRLRTAASAVAVSSPAGTQETEAAGIPPTPAASASPIIDKDGFVVPPRPQRVAELPMPIDPQLDGDINTVIATAATEVDAQLEALADEFGDESESDDSEVDPSSEMAMAAAQGIDISLTGKKVKPSNGKVASRKKNTTPLPVNDEWELDEANLEREMEGHLNDPALIGASAVITKDVEERRARENAAAMAQQPTPAASAPSSSPPLETTPTADGSTDNVEEEVDDGPLDPRFTPRSKVSDDPVVHEDEFADDPEVQFCRLGDAEVKIKEQIWANHNKEYMRQVQQKIFNSKMSEKNSAQKQRRTRIKKPRIGEGQASPAQSAEEAAVNMMRTRGISTKLDYSRLGAVFDRSTNIRGPGSTYGGTSASSASSTLPSTAGSEAGSDDEDEENDNVSRPTTSNGNALRSSSPAASETETAITAPSTEEDDDENSDDGGNGGQDDYEDEQFEETTFDPFADNDNTGFGEEDYDEY